MVAAVHKCKSSGQREIMAASNTPFPCFKTTGDGKHDIDIYTEDLKDYCVMQNWYDSSKETEAQRWTKPDKAIACLRASLPPAARAIYKYSLGLSNEDQKKPHLVPGGGGELPYETDGDARRLA